MTDDNHSERPPAVAPKPTPLQLARQAVQDDDRELAFAVAQDPEATVDALLLLADTGWVRINRELARRVELPDAVAEVLSESWHLSVCIDLADRTDLSDEVLLNLIGHGSYKVRSRLLTRSNIPERVIRTAFEEAIEDDSERVLCWLAEYQGTPADLLHDLKDTHYWRVLERICTNPRTPSKTLHAILEDDIAHPEVGQDRNWYRVIEKVAMHRALPPEDRRILLKHPQWQVREKFAWRDDLTPDEQRALMADSVWQVCEKLAGMEGLEPDVVSVLRNHAQRHVRQAVEDANPTRRARRRALITSPNRPSRPKGPSSPSRPTAVAHEHDASSHNDGWRPGLG